MPATVDQDKLEWTAEVPSPMGPDIFVENCHRLDQVWYGYNVQVASTIKMVSARGATYHVDYYLSVDFSGEGSVEVRKKRVQFYGEASVVLVRTYGYVIGEIYIGSEPYFIGDFNSIRRLSDEETVLDI